MEWINIEDKLPREKWYKSEKDGKRHFYTVPVLVHRKIFLEDGEVKNSISVGEYDTTGIPSRWFVFFETIDPEWGLVNKEIEVKDVTHWMPLPKEPVE